MCHRRLRCREGGFERRTSPPLAFGARGSFVARGLRVPVVAGDEPADFGAASFFAAFGFTAASAFFIARYALVHSAPRCHFAESAGSVPPHFECRPRHRSFSGRGFLRAIEGSPSGRCVVNQPTTARRYAAGGIMSTCEVRAVSTLSTRLASGRGIVLSIPGEEGDSRADHSPDEGG